MIYLKFQFMSQVFFHFCAVRTWFILSVFADASSSSPLCSRRMFPHCKVNLSGLIPCAKYILLVDMVPEDGFRYKVRQLGFVFMNFTEQKCFLLSSVCVQNGSLKRVPGAQSLGCKIWLRWFFLVSSVLTGVSRQTPPLPVYHPPPPPNMLHQRLLSLPVFLSPAGSPL